MERIYEPVIDGVLDVPSLYARNFLIRHYYPGMRVRVLENPAEAPFTDDPANATGKTYRLRPLEQCRSGVSINHGSDDQHWEIIDGGDGGEELYNNPGTEAAINGCAAGTVFTNATHNQVFDAIFSLAFNAGATIVTIAGTGGEFGIVAHGGQWIFEKGVTVDVTAVTGTFSVQAGTITARSVEANAVALDPGPTVNNFTIADGERTAAVSYVAKMTATNASGTPTNRSSAPRTLTPYAPCYRRVVTSSTPGEATMKGGTKFLAGPQALITLMFSSDAAAGERAGASFPLSLGGVKKITDEGGANVYYDANTDPANNAFNRQVGNYTILDGTLEPMETFALKQPAGNGSSFTYKFWF